VAQVLGIDEVDIDNRFPVQEVSTGVPFIIVPLRDLESLTRILVSHERYMELIKDTEAKAILAFCPEAHEPGNHLSARVFADYYGVPEDPATGSANGCLAGYLVMHRYLDGNRIDIRVEQGYEMGRPSLLFLQAEEVDGVIDVRVGGRVIMVATGELIV
jgi:trans-2,3-dihydro-3-hydroxyanthranilate isomerase